MDKYLKITLSALGCATLALVGMFIGYRLTAAPAAEETPAVVSAEAFGLNAEPEVEPRQAATLPRIETRTKMVYEYVYPEDGVIESSEEEAPYFLLNMDEEKLRGVFQDWEIKSFSRDEVVMRKVLEGASAQHYIVGVQDGYVSVFYQNPVNGTALKEITNTPVTALSGEEQSRLAQGVLVSGEEELIRVLEDYSS